MPAVQIQASFKKDERQWDGLAPYIDEMVKNPLTPLVIVCTAEVTKLIEDPREGTVQPRIRLTHIELCHEGNAIKATDVLNQIYGQRTGRSDSQPSLFDDDPQPREQHPTDWPGAESAQPLEGQPDTLAEAADQPSSAPPRKRGRPRKQQPAPAGPADVDDLAHGGSPREADEEAAQHDGMTPGDERAEDSAAAGDPPWPGDVDFREPGDGGQAQA